MDKGVPNPPAPVQERGRSDRLDSWKEIAAYLKREPRTVQRWEKKEGLPVHRHHHEQQATVYAFRSEIDVWWTQRRGRLEHEVEAAEGVEPVAEVEIVRSEPRPTPTGRDKVILAVAILAVLALVVYSLRAWLPSLTGRAPGKIMLAVVPFENLSGDPGQKFFSNGITEDIITELGRLEPERLGVIARTTVMDPNLQGISVRELGRRLKVQYVLEGSCRRMGDNVRITAQLIQVSDQTHLWADSFDVTRPLTDALDIQKEVAVKVANSLRLELLPAQVNRLTLSAPVNPLAYEAYTRGRHVWNQRTEDSLRRGMAYLQEAIAIDPHFSLAHAGLADQYISLGFYSAMAPADAYPKAKQAAERALELDSALAEAHASLGAVMADYEWNWPAAEREFKKAIELNPSYAVAHQWYSQYLAFMGRFDEAWQQAETARQLDPVGLVVNSDVASQYYYQRQFDKAIEHCQEILRQTPDYPLALMWIGLAQLQKNDLQQAIASFARARGAGNLFVALLGMAYGRAGRREDARRVLEELTTLSKKRFVSAAYFSLVYIGLEDKEQAIQWMEKAYQERSPLLARLKVDPVVDSLRDDPRFQDLMRRVGLP